jgi:hypothetical protein
MGNLIVEGWMMERTLMASFPDNLIHDKSILEFNLTISSVLWEGRNSLVSIGNDGSI